MNNKKPYMAPAMTLIHIEASTMLVGSNVTETEVCPGEYAPTHPKKVAVVGFGTLSDTY